MKYTLLHPMNVEAYWPTISPMIREAMEADTLPEELENIKTVAATGIYKIWVGSQGDGKISLVLVAESAIHHGRAHLLLRWASCKGHRWPLRDYHILEQWAHEQGYKQIRLWGRHGWTRQMKSFGFNHEFTVISKNIERGLH